MANTNKLLRVGRELRDAAEELSRMHIAERTRATLNSLVQRYDAAQAERTRDNLAPVKRVALPQPLPGDGLQRHAVTVALSKLVPGGSDCLFLPLQPADTQRTLALRVRAAAAYHGWKLIIRSVATDQLAAGEAGIRVWRKT